MRRMLYFLFLFAPTASFAVEIPKEARVFNTSEHQCVWASLETLARHNQIPELYDLTTKYKKKATPDNVRYVLKKRKIKYKMTLHGRGSHGFLKENIRHGIAFGTNRKHMMTLVHIDDKEAKFIDNSDKNLEVQTWDIKKFNKAFDGWAIVIFKGK